MSLSLFLLLSLLFHLSIGSDVCPLELNTLTKKILELALQNRREYISLTDYIYGWNGYDSLDIWLLHDTHPQEPQSIKILKSISQDVLLRYEQDLVYYNRASRFMENCIKRTVGYVWVFQPIVTPKKSYALISEELLHILGFDSKSFKSFIMKNAVPPGSPAVVKAAISNIQPLLKRHFFKEAYEHLLKFIGGLYYLRELNSTHFAAPARSKRPKDPQEYLSLRITILEKSLKRIFIVDHKLTGLLLHTSWSLAQYLKYTSRLITDLELRERIRSCVEKYLLGVRTFIQSTRDSLKPRLKLVLTDEKRICRHPAGPIVREAYFLEVPFTSGGLPNSHYALVKRGPAGYEKYNFETEHKEIDVFVYLSAPIFDSQKALKLHQDRVISLVCSSESKNKV